MPQGLNLDPVDQLQVAQAVADILTNVVNTLDGAASGTISVALLGQLDAALSALLVNLAGVVVGLITAVVALIVNIDVAALASLNFTLVINVLGLTV